MSASRIVVVMVRPKTRNGTYKVHVIKAAISGKMWSAYMDKTADLAALVAQRGGYDVDSEGAWTAIYMGDGDEE